jgi:hypothetical protein
MMQRVTAARALYDVPYTRFDEMKNRVKKNIELKILSGMTGVEVVAFTEDRTIKSKFMPKGQSSNQDFIAEVYAEIDKLQANCGGTPLNAAMQVALDNAKKRMQKSGKPTFFDIYGDGGPNDKPDRSTYQEYSKGMGEAINAFMHLCITRGEQTPSVENMEHLARQFPIQFNACTDDDNSMQWLNLMDNIVIDKSGNVYKDAAEAKVAGINKHDLVQLHINTSDDMLSESMEIYDAQGSMLTITEGIYLILCAVATLVPSLDDLDNPAKILDADGLLNYYGGDYPSQQEVAQFRAAAKKAQAEAFYRESNNIENSHPLELSPAAKNVYQMDVESRMPSIMRAFEQMKATRLSGQIGYRQTGYGRPIAHFHGQSFVTHQYNSQVGQVRQVGQVGSSSSNPRRKPNQSSGQSIRHFFGSLGGH